MYFPDDVLTELPVEIRQKISRYLFNNTRLELLGKWERPTFKKIKSLRLYIVYMPGQIFGAPYYIYDEIEWKRSRGLDVELY